MAIQIERGVELPRSRSRNGKVPTYPFLQMKPGDSFVAPIAPKQQGYLKLMADRKVPDAAFATRVVDGGVRIWRVA